MLRPPPSFSYTISAKKRYASAIVARVADELTHSPSREVRRRAGHHLVRTEKAQLFEHATKALGNRGLARARSTREPKVEVERLRERGEAGNVRVDHRAGVKGLEITSHFDRASVNYYDRPLASIEAEKGARMST